MIKMKRDREKKKEKFVTDKKGYLLLVSNSFIHNLPLQLMEPFHEYGRGGDKEREKGASKKKREIRMRRKEEREKRREKENGMKKMKKKSTFNYLPWTFPSRGKWIKSGVGNF